MLTFSPGPEDFSLSAADLIAMDIHPVLLQIRRSRTWRSFHAEPVGVDVQAPREIPRYVGVMWEGNSYSVGIRVCRTLESRLTRIASLTTRTPDYSRIGVAVPSYWLTWDGIEAEPEVESLFKLGIREIFRLEELLLLTHDRS